MLSDITNPQYSKILIRITFWLSLLWFATNGAIADAINPTPPSRTQAGKQIYREGILPDGNPLRAAGAVGTSITGQQTACINCHRRSALGTSEGETLVPPITGEILFQPRTQSYKQLRGKRLSGEGARPAYTPRTLLRAINDGKDSTGRSLSPLMPRYNLSSENLKSLTEYLKTLSAKNAPGVTGTVIHLATVFTPDTSPAQKTPAEKILRTFFRDYNAQTRNETRRAEDSPWHKSWHYESFRQLELHTWNLEGKENTWASQLQTLYEQQPVFALVNGIGGDSWQPVHDFCEQIEMPCLFPTTDVPGESTAHYYSIYFSDGVELEARAIASHIENQFQSPATILQLYRDTQKGRRAVSSLTRQFTRNEKVKTVKLAQANRTVDDAYLRMIIEHNEANLLVLWLEDPDIDAFRDELGNNSQLQAIYLSSTYTKRPTQILPTTALDKTYVVSRFASKNALDRHLQRFNVWAKFRDIHFDDQRIAANAYFAATTVAAAIRNMRANLARDYLIERIEHMMERPVFHSVFPPFTLGPDQRFASKGSYVIGPFKLPNKHSSLPRQWIVP